MTRASQPPHDLPGDLADMDPAALRARLLTDLARAKAVFQLRAICAVLELPRGGPMIHQTAPSFHAVHQGFAPPEHGA